MKTRLYDHIHSLYKFRKHIFQSVTGKLPSFEHWHEVIIECHKTVERFE